MDTGFFFTGGRWRSRAALQWGERGTWNVPSTDIQHPIALEAPVRNDLWPSQTVIHSSTFPTLISTTPLDSNGDLPFPLGIRSGDTLLIVGGLNSITGGGSTLGFSGFTALDATISDTTASVFAFYKVATGTETGTLAPTGRGISEIPQGILYVLRGADTTVAPAISAAANGSSTAPDPSSLTPSWGLQNGSFFVVAVSTRDAASAATINAYPSGYTENTYTTSLSAIGAVGTVGLRTRTGVVASEDAAAFTLNFTNLWEARTIAVKAPANVLRLRTNFRVVQPGTFTPSQTFYTHTVTVSSGTVTLTPARHTNSSAFFTHTLRVTMKPSAYSDGDTFYTQTLRVTLRPSLYADPDTFYSLSLRRTIRPTNYTDADTFYTQSLRQTLRPTNLVDADTFYGPTVSISAANKSPPLHINSQAFFSPSIRRTIRPSALASTTQTLNPTIRVTLRPGLHADADAFFAPSLRRTLRPSLYADPDTFFGPSLRVTLKPSLHSDADTFYTQSLRVTLKPTLYTDADTFYSAAVSVAGANKQTPLVTNSQTFFVPRILATLKPAAATNTSAFFAPHLQRTLRPALHTNTQTFFAPSLRIRISPAAYANPQTFRAVTIRLAGSVVAPLYVNAQAFYGASIITARIGGGYGDDEKKKKKRLVIPAVETAGQKQVPRPAPAQTGKRGSPPPALPVAPIMDLLRSDKRVTPVQVTTTQTIDTRLWAEVYEAMLRGEERRQIKAELQQIEAERLAAERFEAEQWLVGEMADIARAWVEENAPHGEEAIGAYHGIRRKREEDEERFIILAAMELLR